MAEKFLKLSLEWLKFWGRVLPNFTFGGLVLLVGLSGVLACFSSALDGYWERDSIMCVTSIALGILFWSLSRFGWGYLKGSLTLFYPKFNSTEVME